MIINNHKINYIQYGEGKDIILLHGWGQNIEMMKPLGDKLINNKITIIDFPGFGKSDELKEKWTINTYTNMLKEFIIKKEITNPIIIGHSFGGRVAINYAAHNECEKLILFGSPCIRDTNMNLSMSVKILKKIKKIPGLNSLGDYMKKYIGSRDYKNASPILRDTLVEVINTDLSEEAKKIKAPTLLIWGTDDDEAPLSDAKKLEAIMRDAGLIELPGSHYAYLENLNQVIKIITKFI